MIGRIFLLLIFTFSFSFSQSDTALIFSEVMFSPASGNNEFIEIYNTSSTLSINLVGFKIKYYTSTADVITDAGFGTVLPPNSFAVIFENDYDLATGIYKPLIPANALILKIADNSFGTSGMANTTSRPLRLLNTNTDTLDYYFYSANNAAAISDEKKILNRDSLQTNWANSLVINGTPGFANSVTPINYDLGLSSLIILPSIPVSGNDITVSAKVKNKGVLIASNFQIEIFNDANKDSVGELIERIFSQTYSNLFAGDSITATTILNALPAGDYQIIAMVNFTQDQNQNNNRLIKIFSVAPPNNNFNDVVVNEIMYAPSSNAPEWIELFNRTPNPINLKYWKFSDASSTITITTLDKYIFLILLL
jgi:hypothetical protein